MSSPVSTISEIGKHDGQTVTIRGWLYNLRESGKLLFPQFRDGSGVIQGVVPKNAVSPEVFEAIKTLTQESSVIVEGKVRADKMSRMCRSYSGCRNRILIPLRPRSTAPTS
jgi:asparaginyl-tRNA synthetase